MSAPRARAIRELCLQVLYQLDANNGEDLDQIRSSVEDAPYVDDDQGIQQIKALSPEDKSKAMEVAERAWQCRTQIDAIATELAPDWPTHRQPVVDRNLIRLAWYEMAVAKLAPPIVINEVILIAKEFSTDASARFLNGVIDSINKKLQAGELAVDESLLGEQVDDPWLADALTTEA